MFTLLGNLEIITMESGEEIAVLHDHNPNYAVYILIYILVWVIVTELICLLIKKKDKKRLQNLADKIEKRHNQIETEKFAARNKEIN